MFPRRGVSGLFYRLAGEGIFLDRVEANLLNEIKRIRHGRTHTYLSNNGQTEDGNSQNAGAVRHYSWQSTLIDGREMPGFAQSQALDRFVSDVEQSSGFKGFRDDIQTRSNGFLNVSPFVKVVHGQQNKRYNIRLDSPSKYEAFDIVRTGLKVEAASPEDFKMGLFHMLNWEKRHHPDYRGLLIIPEKAPA